MTEDFDYAKSWLEYILKGANNQTIPENIINEYVQEWMISPFGFDGSYDRIGPFEILIDFIEYAGLKNLDSKEGGYIKCLSAWCNEAISNAPEGKIPSWKMEDGGFIIEYVQDKESDYSF